MVRRALATAVGLVLLVPAATASAAAPASCGLASPEFTATGDFPASRQGSFVFVPFQVGSGVTQVRVNYCYDGPSPGPPDGGNNHTLDLGVYEPRPSGDTGPWGPDEFRGWGGSGYDRVNITPRGFPDDAHYAADRKAPVDGLTTRSFKPGPIPEGQWAVELGLANIAGPPFDTDASVGWRVEVDLSNPRPPRPTRPRRTTPARWTPTATGTRVISTCTPSTLAMPTPRSPRRSTTGSARPGWTS